MRVFKVLGLLLVWYVFATLLLFAAIHLMSSKNWYIFDLAIAICLFLLGFFGLKENFLTNSIGKIGTLLAMGFLLWCSVISFVYIGIYLYGDGL